MLHGGVSFTQSDFRNNELDMIQAQRTDSPDHFDPASRTRSESEPNNRSIVDQEGLLLG